MKGQLVRRGHRRSHFRFTMLNFKWKVHKYSKKQHSGWHSTVNGFESLTRLVKLEEWFHMAYVIWHQQGEGAPEYAPTEKHFWEGFLIWALAKKASASRATRATSIQKSLLTLKSTMLLSPKASESMCPTLYLGHYLDLTAVQHENSQGIEHKQNKCPTSELQPISLH